MLNDFELPIEFRNALDGETRDFIVRAKRSEPIYNGLFTLAFFGLWTWFVGNFLPLTIKSFRNDGTLVFLFFNLVLIALGLYFIQLAVRSIFFSGSAYCAGTPTRLVYLRHGQLRSIPWNTFTGEIIARGNDENGSLKLVLRTGHMMRTKHSRRFVADTIYLGGITDATRIKEICTQRITTFNN